MHPWFNWPRLLGISFLMKRSCLKENFRHAYQSFNIIQWRAHFLRQRHRPWPPSHTPTESNWSFGLIHVTEREGCLTKSSSKITQKREFMMGHSRPPFLLEYEDCSTIISLFRVQKHGHVNSLKNWWAKHRLVLFSHAT